MANQYLEQQLAYNEGSQEEESLEDYIEEEEVDTSASVLSTTYTNKLIDLSLAAQTEAQRRDEKFNRSTLQGDADLEEVRTGINFLQVLSTRRLKAYIEAKTGNNDDQSDSNSSDPGRHGDIADSPNTVTVFSQTSLHRRDSQGSSELPSYVKKMMEKDASLRRLLKTGCVTISQIQPSVNSKMSTNSATIQNHASTHHNDNSNGDPLALPEPIEFDWSDCPYATKLMEFARIVEEEKTEHQTSRTLPASSGNQQVSSDHFFTVPPLSVNRVNLPHRRPISKTPHRFIPSSTKQPQANLSTRGITHAYTTSSNKLPPKLVPVHAYAANNLQKTRVSVVKADNNVKPDRAEAEEIDPTRFLEVSLLEDDHIALSDEHRRKYKCPHCPKAFCWSTDLKRHILTHTGERPFKCLYCSANFTRKFLMQKHVRKYHPGMDSEVVGKLGKSSSASVSNGKKMISTPGTNGVYILPEPYLKTETTTMDDPECDSGEYFNNQEQGFEEQEEDYDDEENGEDEQDIHAKAEAKIIQHFYADDDDEQEDEDLPRGGIIKEEMLEDEDEFVEYVEPPDQYFDEGCPDDPNLMDEDLPQSKLQQKYLLESKLTNTSGSNRNSGPIVINVFSSNAPIKDRTDDGGEFYQPESTSNAPRRISQSLVNQLARASAKLKGEMAKTTSAREALRLLVKR